MIIKENKSTRTKLNLKYIWLIKIKPKINRGVLSFFHSINQCFTKRHKQRKEKKERKREKEIDSDFQRARKHKQQYSFDNMEQNQTYNDFLNQQTINKNNKKNKKQTKIKKEHKSKHHHHHHEEVVIIEDDDLINGINKKEKSKKHHHHHQHQRHHHKKHHHHHHHGNEDNETDDYDNENYINVPHKGEIAQESRQFDNNTFLEELSKYQMKYENEMKLSMDGSASNETLYEYAKKLSNSQDKENRMKSIELFLECLNKDQTGDSEKYLIELGTTYYKQEDFESSKFYVDQVLQCSPFNRKALSLKYLIEPIPIEIKS